MMKKLLLTTCLLLAACSNTEQTEIKQTEPQEKTLIGERVIIDPKIADFPKVLLWCEGTTLFALSRVDGSDWDANAAGGGGIAVAAHGCPNGEVPGR